MRTLYISDLDGTLLNDNAVLSDFSRKNLKILVENGLLFTVATARTKATVKEMFSDVGLQLPWILMNGVLIYDPKNDRIISSNEISKADAEKILSAYKKYGKTPMLYFLKENYLEIHYKTLDNIFQKQYVEARQNLTEKKFKECKEGLCINSDDRLVYMVSLDKKEILHPICEEIRSLGSVTCAFYRDNYTDCNFMECMNGTVSKGVAADKIKELLGIDRIIAFGDNLNDLPLFEIADECYAVSNACPELKEVAAGIIDSNNNDGVVRFILNNFNI